MSLSPASHDWMVLQCGACRSRMKVQRSVAMDSRIFCPTCHTPIPTGETPLPAAAETFSPTALPARTPLAPRTQTAALPQRTDPTIQGSLPTASPTAPTAPPAGESGHLPPDRRMATNHAEFSGQFDPSAWQTSPASDHAEDEPDSDQEAHQRLHPEERRRVKIKKRRTKNNNARKYQELTDWDQTELTQLPEAEVTADIWEDVRPLPEDVIPAEEENDYVVESVEEEDGQTRTTKKKIRRKKLLLGARLFFLRLFSLSRYAGIGLALIVAGVALYGVYVFRQKYEAPPLPPDQSTVIDRSVLTSYDLLGAEKAIRDFLAADGIEAKLAFVRQPARIRPLMERWYRGERTAAPLQAGESTLQDKRGGEPGSTGYYVIMAMPVFMPDPLNPGSTYEEMTFFAVEEIRNGPDSTYLVDWETSTGYQEIPLETYKSTMPPEPSPFRIYMKADNYYNHSFEERDWQCVALYYPGRDFHLWGYISRTTLDGRAMLPLVENGGRAGIIAQLVYPADAVSRDQVEVRKMIHPSWFYATALEATPFGEAVKN